MHGHLSLAAFVTGLLMLLVGCGGDAPPVVDASDQWRATDATLADRVERLATAGEADAALGVFAELNTRPGNKGAPAEQRARLALARALVVLGRNDDALVHLHGISWADKSPDIATQVLGLEARLRWQQLTVDGAVVTGAILAMAAADAPQGQPRGPWLARREAYAALAEILDHGARLVRAEGGTPDLPAIAPQLALARYAFGDRSRAELATSLGETSSWTPALALAVLRVQLAEHEIDDAAAVATILWEQHAGTPEAAEGFRRLRVWQLLRERAASGLFLWAYPELDARLRALITTWPAAEQAARAELATQQDVNGQAVASELVRARGVMELSPVENALETDEVDAEPPEAPLVAREFALAKSWPGLAVGPVEPIVALGTVAAVTVRSEHRGEHRVNVWRLADAEAYDLLARAPTQAHLPVAPLSDRLVTVAPWSSLDASQTAHVDLGVLNEGFYAVSVTARGCPVVVVSGFTVCDVDLHTIAGRDALVAWVVRRSDGCGKGGEPLRAVVTLVRDPQLAAGPAWAKADDAWRAGFRASFLTLSEQAWQGAVDRASFVDGQQAGASAALTDPAFEVTLRAVSDAQGLARWELPANLHTRSWKVRVSIDRAQVAVVATAQHQASGSWNAVQLAWADKPVVRPGETLRFKALLRDWDGEVWRRSIGMVAVEVLCGGSRLSAGQLAVSDVGSIAGAVDIPPGCTAGKVRLVVKPVGQRVDGLNREDDGQQIATILERRLPPGSLQVVDDGDEDLHAGETRSLRMQLRNEAGDPLAGAAVDLVVNATDLGNWAHIPQAVPQQLVTDASGELVVRIPSPRTSELALVATFTAHIAHQHLTATSSWTTRCFPVPLAVELPQRTVSVGNLLRVRIRLPLGATVQVGLLNVVRLVGETMTVTGTGGWQEVSIVPTAGQQGATAVRITAAELGGGQASRDVPVTINGLPPAGDSPVRCIPGSTTVLPGAELALTLGTTLPGRDLLLLGGTGTILVTKVAHLADPALSLALPVAAGWAPNLGFKALAWLPGSGFTESQRQEVTVLPVDRLLTVAALPDRAEYRMGEVATITMKVTDWHQAAVAGASLSLGLVDERLYALGEDRTPDLLNWFTDRHRAWTLDEASAAAVRNPQAELWRAVARRRIIPEALLSGGSGARRRSAMGGCQACRSSNDAIPVLPEADATIHWSADLRTAADGTATVRITLPGAPGRFRITARANDASAAILVGEVRGEVVVREPLTCSIQGPGQAVNGDALTLTAEVASRLPGLVPLTVRIHRDGDPEILAQRTVSLAAGTRQSIALPITVQLPSTGEVRQVGGLLGRAVRLIVEVQAPGGERMLQAHHDVLMALAGVPNASTRRLVADAHGEVPEVIAPAGAAVWLRLRAWPDAGARRRAELRAWRSVEGVRGALAWLLAEPGQERSDELARRWPLLGTDGAADYVRLVARRLGSATSFELSATVALQGPWLAACGRSLGLPLAVPSAVEPEDEASACAGAAIALRSDARGAGRRWLAARSLITAESITLTLVFALDAARVAGDEATVERLQAELATRDWPDDFVAVVAADLLPATSGASAASVVLHPVGPAVPLAGGEWTIWSGIATSDLRVSAVPGALLMIDTVVQAVPSTLPQPQVRLLRLHEEPSGAHDAAGMPLGGRQFTVVPDGGPVELGEHLALEVPGSGPYVLPALLQLAPVSGDIILIDHVEETWQLPKERVSAVPAQWFAAMAVQRASVGVSRHGDGADTAPDAGSRRIVRAGLLLVEACSVGRCAVSGGLPLEVVIELPPTVPEPPFPLISELQARFAASAPEEQQMLLDEEPHTRAAWQRLIAVCDPAQVEDLTLDELLRHPLCGRRDHRTTIALRRWIDHEPAFDGLESATGILPLTTLEEVIDLAVTSRAARQSTIAHQPFPAPAETSRPQPLRRSIARCLERGLLTLPEGQSVDDWCWTSSVSADEFGRLGYGATAEEWARFLNTEFGFRTRLGRGVPGGVAQDADVVDQPFAPAGDRLGFAGLSGAGLELVTVGDGFELRSISDQPVLVSVVAKELPLAAVVDLMNRQLEARGLPTVRYDPPATDVPITLVVRNMQPRHLLAYLVKLSGATLENHAGQPCLALSTGQ